MEDLFIDFITDVLDREKIEFFVFIMFFFGLYDCGGICFQLFCYITIIDCIMWPLLR